MIIYRIQLENGEGPHRNDANYHLEFVLERLAGYEPYSYNAENSHPTPVRAFNEYAYDKFRSCEDYIFGFSCIEDYHKWTMNDAVRLDLKEHKFKIQLFDIDEFLILRAKNQIAFKLSDATKLETIDCI